MRGPKRGHLILVGFLVAAILLIGGIIAYGPAFMLEAAPISSPPIGMKLGERFHDIHTKKLKLKCDFCHVENGGTYNDPLAQVFNLADKRACLSCHKEGSAQPFFGEDWQKAKVKR